MSIHEILNRKAERQFNRERRLRLSCLAKLIPYEKKSFFLINVLLESALNIDFTDITSFVKQENVQTTLKILRDNIAKGELKASENAEPFEKFLILAIARNKNWEQLIREHQLYLLLPFNRRMWTMRDVWLLQLCLAGFSKEEGYVLAFQLLNRPRNVMKANFCIVSKLPSLETKLKNRLGKSLEELRQVYDDDERNLLIAIATQTTYALALDMECFRRMRFEKVVKNQMNAFWISYLCYTFADNFVHEYPEVHWKIKTVKWRTISSFDNKRAEIRRELEFKLKDILQRYQSFDNHFTDQMEVIILTSLKRGSSWNETKQKINSLFENVRYEKQNRWYNLSQYRQNKGRKLTKADESKAVYNPNYLSKHQHLDSRKIRRYDKSYEPSKLILKKWLKHQTDKQNQIQNDRFPRNSKNQQEIVNDNAINYKTFNLNEQQMLVLSLLERGKQHIRNLEMQVLQSITLPQFGFQSQNQQQSIISPLDSTVLYNEICCEVINLSQPNDSVQTIQPVDLPQPQEPHLLTEKQEHENEIVSSQELDLSGSFIQSYNKIMRQLKRSTVPPIRPDPANQGHLMW